MLIGEEIDRLRNRERLFLVESLDWRANRERVIYASRDLHQFLEHPSASPGRNAERRKLQRLFDRFISGQEIAVAFERRIKGSDLKRLTPRRAEVWEFKVRTRPQLRVFGRFAQTDVFLALTGPVDRAHCNYNEEITRCQQEWNTLLPAHSPVYGSTLNDYISAKGISL